MKNEDAMKFLVSDFNQCYSQIRHYDNQLWSICKFVFSAYTALLGISIAVFENHDKVDFTSAAIAMLIVGAILGIIMFVMIIRNRYYFVIVARYVNEQRSFFLVENPMGFENNAKMFQDWQKPPFFSWLSTHLLISYLIAILNGGLVGTLIYIINQDYCSAIIIGTIIAAVQITVGIRCLCRRDKTRNEKEKG